MNLGHTTRNYLRADVLTLLRQRGPKGECPLNLKVHGQYQTGTVLGRTNQHQFLTADAVNSVSNGALVTTATSSQANRACYTVVERLAFVVAEIAGSVASWAFAHSGDRSIPRR